MAMIGELFAAFDNLKNLVEKIAETVEKTSDSSSYMVCVCVFIVDTNKMPVFCC